MRYRELIEIVEASKPQKPLPPKAGVRTPRPPMTPAQSHAEFEKRTKLQSEIRDTQATCAKRLRDLRAKL